MDDNLNSSNQLGSPPNQSTQPNQPAQSFQNDPVFSSSDLTQSKARKDTQYFTNVQKATLGQKISNWFNKINRESLERSTARKASFQAKLEARRHAADLTKLSSTVPNPAISPQPTNQPAAAQTTIIIDAPSLQPKGQNKRTLIVLLVLLAILIIGVIATLLIARPWDKHVTAVSATGQVVELKGEPTGNIDMAISTSVEALSFQSQVINSTTLDVYTDSQLPDSTSRSPYIIASNIDQVVRLNQITDPAAIMLFEIEKARVFIIYEDYESAWEILEQIDEENLYESQQKTFFAVMQLYYENIDDTEKAAEYFEKYQALPVEEME